MKFKYSVLMSVYSKENPKWLEESIESMVNQTIEPDEIVIVEDGPLTPELEKIIEQEKEKYPQLFNIVKLEKNQGLGPALAIGVKNCKNEYIARMDTDDIAINTRIEKQYEIIKEKDVDIVGTTVAEFIDKIDNIKGYRNLPEQHEEIYKYSRKRNPFAHPSVILKKSKVLEAGNFRSYYLCEDYDMWIRMIEKGAKCYNIQENLVYMRVSEDFYKRRGGIKYLKSILKFKTEQYKKGYYTLLDYIQSAGSHIIICLIPNKIREYIYLNILRKKEKSA